MVKHAAREKEPLYYRTGTRGTSLDKLTANNIHTGPAAQWFDRIRHHKNLSIEREFRSRPASERSGGWMAAERVFEGKLLQWLSDINEAV